MSRINGGTSAPKIYIALLGLMVAAVACLSPAAYAATRIKDIAQINGVRKNQLVGYGLVVGLNGTGDKSSVLTAQAAATMLDHLGISVSPAALKIKNVASVLVTADLPAFAKEGNQVDVTVSSVGDASSLQGGTLVMTPLKAGNGQVYAVAQGQIVIGAGDQGRGRGGHQTVGRIPSGAIVEKEAAFNLVDQQTKTFDIVLSQPDFTTASNVSRQVNAAMKRTVAKTVSPSTVTVEVQDDWDDLMKVIADIENLPVPVDVKAKIVVNETNGAVVMGGNVKVLPVAITYGDLTVAIAGSKSSNGKTTDTSYQSTVNMEKESTVSELVKILNALGASAKDVVGILVALKDSGALLAELETI